MKIGCKRIGQSNSGQCRSVRLLCSSRQIAASFFEHREERDGVVK